ncbi:hypothetical protein [Bacterioplanoides pacificum]|uniref:Uncharacterized protein n=1 Tax=Bacterioplanoides pacificum TaxID=1171596 RepID=A0ABV7VMA8_9GAMM
MIEPAAPVTLTEGSSVQLTASAQDHEDGELSANITWSSSRDGSLGSGETVSATLSAGTHTITASVTDSTGITPVYEATITVIVTQGGVE